MEFWEKESAPEGANQGASYPKSIEAENGAVAERGQNQSSQPGSNSNCSIVINGQVIAQVDVSNVEEVQKIVTSLSRKRKTSKDFNTESKGTLSQTQTPEGSRHSSVEYQPLPNPAIQHNIQEPYTDEGSHQVTKEAPEFISKRHHTSNPYPVFPQSSNVNMQPQEQPIFSYRNNPARPPSAISNYSQPTTRTESFQHWKQQQQQQFGSTPGIPQHFQNPHDFMKDDYYWERRNSMPSYASQRPYIDPQQQQPQPSTPKMTNPPYPIRKEPSREQQQQQQNYQNFLLQQQRMFHTLAQDDFANYSHPSQQTQQQQYSNYPPQQMYSNSVFPQMPTYQSSFGGMQKSSSTSNPSWPLPLTYSQSPKSSTTTSTTTTTATSATMPEFPPTRPIVPDSRRNSTSSIELRSKNAPPGGKSKDSEQKRRNRINDRLTDLKDLLPEFTEHPEKTATKEEILSETIRYIRLLESECVELTEAITEKQRMRNMSQSYGMMGGEHMPKDMESYYSKRHPTVEDDSS